MIIRQKVLIFKQILPTGVRRNVLSTVRRVCTLILGGKGLKKGTRKEGRKTTKKGKNWKEKKKRKENNGCRQQADYFAEDTIIFRVQNQNIRVVFN